MESNLLEIIFNLCHIKNNLYFFEYVRVRRGKGAAVPT